MDRGEVINADRQEQCKGQNVDTSKVFEHGKIILPAQTPVKPTCNYTNAPLIMRVFSF